MNTRIPLLAALAAVQLVIIGWFWFGQSQPQQSATSLLSIDPAAVSSLAISSTEDGQSVTLTKTGGTWNLGDLPADGDKIAELLGKLSSLTGGWPVATSTSAAQRFEVGEDNYQRKVVVSSEAATATLLFGTSPSFQQVHARVLDDTAVYVVKLSNFELATGIDTWLDKGLMALPQAPKKVSLRRPNGSPLQTLEAALEPGVWLFNEQPADPAEATNYVNRFASLRVLGRATEDELASAEAVAELVIDDRLTYQIDRIPGALDGEEDGGASTAESYLIRDLGAPDGQIFQLATYVAEQLLMTDANFLSAADPGQTESAPQ